MKKIEKNIHCDIQREIYKYYENNGIQYKNNEKPEDTIVDFFSYMRRLILPIKRTVHYASELDDKISSKIISIDDVKILKSYEEAFTEGKNMNCFLSNKVKCIREPDFLLYAWNIYHLHMSGKFVDSPTQMKNNRSDKQLLCIISISDVYFIDVISHPSKPEEYFDLHSMEIVADNEWMEHIGFCEIPDIIQTSSKTETLQNTNIFKLYSQGACNTSFEIKGKVYCPLETMSTARRPSKATIQLKDINNRILEVIKLEGIYKGFVIKSNENGMPKGIFKYELMNGTTEEFNIFDRFIPDIDNGNV